MAQYVFPSSHSPYSTQQPVVYTTSTPGHGGYTYGTPLRRATSAGHAYTTSPGYTYSTAVPSPGVQYLTVPNTHHRSRSRHNSHGHHGHGHGYSVNTSYPATYATTAPAYVQSSGHHRSHSRSHRYPSRSHSQSHHSRSHSHSRGYNGDYYRGRTPSVGDRVRNFFGMEPSSNSYYYGNQGRSRHNSFSGNNHNTRTGPLIFGSTNPRGFLDKHGREIDHRGRPIQRY